MAESIRVGLIGCGRIGTMHAELVARRVAGLDLSAVYDVSDNAAASVSESLGVRCTASAAELIAADDVDVVAICSSTDTHIDLLVEVASVGKPVFVEKPLSLDLGEVDRGIAAATAAGIAVRSASTDASMQPIARCVIVWLLVMWGVFIWCGYLAATLLHLRLLTLRCRAGSSAI